MFGPTLIARFLPHRPPFVMVDAVTSYAGGDVPSLSGEFTVPREAWPSVYILEGLGQCSGILTALRWHEVQLAEKGVNEMRFREALHDLDAGSDDSWTEIAKDIGESPHVDMLAAVDVKVLGRVAAGDLLRYELELTRVIREMSRFAIRAHVDDRTVAQGTLVGARVEGIAI